MKLFNFFKKKGGDSMTLADKTYDNDNKLYYPIAYFMDRLITKVGMKSVLPKIRDNKDLDSSMFEGWTNRTTDWNPDDHKSMAHYFYWKLLSYDIASLISGRRRVLAWILAFVAISYSALSTGVGLLNMFNTSAGGSNVALTVFGLFSAAIFSIALFKPTKVISFFLPKMDLTKYKEKRNKTIKDIVFNDLPKGIEYNDLPEDFKQRTLRFLFRTPDGKPISDKIAPEMVSDFPLWREVQLIFFTVFLTGLAGTITSLSFISGNAVLLTGSGIVLGVAGVAAFVQLMVPHARERYYRILEESSLNHADFHVYDYDGGKNAGDFRNAGRKEQILNACMDKSPVVNFGWDTGITDRRNDELSIPKNCPVGLTTDELRTHILCFGATGTGKTFSLIKPTLNQYIQANQGGGLILDGKGQLAEEMAGTVLEFTKQQGKGKNGEGDYLLFDPDRKKIEKMRDEGGLNIEPLTLPIIKGLNADEVTEVVATVSVKEDERSDFWSSSAFKLMKMSGILLEYVCERTDEKWNLANFYRAAMESDYRSELMNKLAATGTNIKKLIKEDKLFARAFRYLNDEYPKTAENTRSGFTASAGQMLGEITENRKLEAWVYADEGDDPLEALRGRFVGLNLPAIEYGRSGILIAQMIKRKMYKEVMKRGNTGWQKSEGGQGMTLIVIDECQEIADKQDADITLAQGRSLGLGAVFATQTIPGLIAAQGDKVADKLINTFGNVLTLRSDPQTHEFISTWLGDTNRAVVTTSGCDVSIQSSLETISEMTLNRKVTMIDEIMNNAQDVMQQILPISNKNVSTTPSKVRLVEANEFPEKLGSRQFSCVYSFRRAGREQRGIMRLNTDTDVKQGFKTIEEAEEGSRKWKLSQIKKAS